MCNKTKMADEVVEGVGDSSSNFIQNVQKSARELLRVSLEYKNSKAADGGVQSDVLSLIREKMRLRKERIACLIEIELRQQLLQEPVEETSFSDGSADELRERVSELELNVVQRRSRQTQDQLLLQRLQESTFLTNHLFANPEPSNEDKALLRLVEEQCGLSSDVVRVGDEVREGEKERVRVERKRRESQTRCRELMTQLREKMRTERTESSESTSEEITRLTASLQLLTAESHLLRHSLQGVIAGSGVDWAGRKELRELTVGLGSAPHWALQTATYQD